jgi:streptomycin 6-kinase
VLQPQLARKLFDVYGDTGREWVEAFPATLERVRQHWALTLGETFAYVGGAYVARAGLPDGTPAVLKLAPPDKEAVSEAAALRHYDGRGICRLLDADESVVALLLERLDPGETLATLEDDAAATDIAANVMKRLFRPLPAGHAFPTIERWGQAFERVRQRYGGGCGSFPPELFEPAARLYLELCASQAEPVLLHGDLHHYNILSATREPWLAIDPKGLAGEPAYEIGPYLYNRLDAGPDLRALTLRRIDQFATILGFDRQRLIGWGFCQSVLSALWTFEDGGEVTNDHLRVARALAPFV